MYKMWKVSVSVVKWATLILAIPVTGILSIGWSEAERSSRSWYEQCRSSRVNRNEVAAERDRLLDDVRELQDKLDRSYTAEVESDQVVRRLKIDRDDIRVELDRIGRSIVGVVAKLGQIAPSVSEDLDQGSSHYVRLGSEAGQAMLHGRTLDGLPELPPMEPMGPAGGPMR